MAARALGVAPSAAASMRRWMARPPAIPLVLGVGAFVLALVQRPGHLVVASRVELTVDPALFLHRVASLWSSTMDLGHIQSGQFVGYLFPMAPGVAGAKAVGVAMSGARWREGVGLVEVGGGAHVDGCAARDPRRGGGAGDGPPLQREARDGALR